MGRKPSTSASELPERIRYLQPFRKKFARRPPEDLNEDSGTAPLMALLSKRIHGLSIPEAADVLEQDGAALEQWLSSLGENGDPLHFAQGFFLATSTEEIAKLIKEEAEKPPKPKLCLQMQLPPDAKLRRVKDAEESGKLIILKGLWLAIEALPKEAVENLADDTARNTADSTYSVLPVAFGEATGRKIITKGQSWRGPFKTVSYALDVPGGHVIGSISAIGKMVDELQLG